MDIQSTGQQQTGSDDSELAKVLAGVNEQIEKDQEANGGLHFEETPAMGTPMPAAEPAVTPITPPTSAAPEPIVPAPAPAAAAPAPVPTADESLEGIKKDALNELRPLVDKLNVSPEEKFDTYLLLLRSTDDRSLIGPAHDAAKDIADETRRAQALLDVIKEIDYLSQAPGA
jgi:hypothetical protein